MRHPDYFQALIAMYQLINTFFGGMFDETISSIAHRLKVERGRKLVSAIINVIFYLRKTNIKRLVSLNSNERICLK